MKSFDEFFRAATGHPPYGYQDGWPATGCRAVVQAPTGMRQDRDRRWPGCGGGCTGRTRRLRRGG